MDYDEEAPPSKRTRASSEQAIKRPRTPSEDPSAEEPVNRPLPFTCIHYEGHFKVTDSDGMFITQDPKDPNKHKIMRCEEDPSMHVVYTYIRSVNTEDLDGIENIDELNVLKNLTTNNKSLYY